MDSLDDKTIISELKGYVEPRMNPFRASYLDTIAQCYKFKELDQWSGVDKSRLDEYGVPDIPVDRINRGLDTINGIDENTGGRVEITGFESGDFRVAKILNMVCEHIETEADVEESEMLAFDALKDVGLGLMKVGFDYTTGSIFVDFVNTEDFAWGKSKKRNLEDINWCWEHQTVGWEEAAILFPEKASEIRGLKSLAKSEWDKIRQDSGSNVTAQTRDYGTGADATEVYPDLVHIWEFWIRKVSPYKKLGRLVQGMAEIVRVESDYEPLEGEEILGDGLDVKWMQSVVVSGENFDGGILVRNAPSGFNWHPYVAMLAEKKKSGQPRGYIEVVKPHQIRLNLAWSQKVAFNNKSIKSPLMLEGPGVTPEAVENATFQSKIGSVFVVPTGVKASPMQPPNINLQAIEEAASAKQDMDFAAAATEGPLVGQSASGDSGIKLSLMQNAAITPLNKWVKAKHRAKKVLWKKILDIIVRKYKMEDVMRIVSPEKFLRLSGYTISPEGKLVPLTADQEGNPLPPPIQWPLDPTTSKYDVKIVNSSVSDFNKQQAFNATESLVGGGVVLTDEFRIKQAPIKNTEDALESNQKARQDLIRALLAKIQMLEEQSTPSSNARSGKNASQTGKRSMLGGQNGVLGMG